MNHVPLRAVKQGEVFKRKANSNKVYVRHHYNPRDAFGPATFCCSDFHDMNRNIQLKPSTLVFVGFTF